MYVDFRHPNFNSIKWTAKHYTRPAVMYTVARINEFTVYPVNNNNLLFV